MIDHDLTTPDSAPQSHGLDLTAVADELQRSPLWRLRGQDARTLIKRPDLRLVLIALRAGERIPEHRTERRALLRVLSGRLQVTLPTGTVELQPGEDLVVEPAAPHDVLARADSAFLLSLGPACAAPPPERGCEPELGALWAEHQRFGRLLALVEEQLTRLERGGEPDYELLRDVFAYLLEFPDRLHHPKEDLLFARLSRRLAAARADVEALRSLHAQLATSGARFLDTLERALAEVELVPRDAVAAAGREYVARFREHMAIEAERLFPLACDHLTAADWEEVHLELQALLDATRPAEAQRRARLRQIARWAECGCT